MNSGGPVRNPRCRITVVKQRVEGEYTYIMDEDVHLEGVAMASPT